MISKRTIQRLVWKITETAFIRQLVTYEIHGQKTNNSETCVENYWKEYGLISGHSSK